MKFSFPPRLALRALGAAVLGAALLSACGGSTSQIDKFQPAHVIAFGDELSVLTDAGHNYSINGVSTTNSAVVDCTVHPMWVQSMASAYYSKVFSQCPGTDTSPDKTAYDLAANGATVADLVTQIDAYQAATGLTEQDLVTVLVGMHDVLALYAQYDGTTASENALVAAAADRGELLAQQVIRIVATGAKVLISTVPDLSPSPFALKEKADTGEDRPAVIKALTDAMNKAMRTGLTSLDGTQAGLLLADDLIRAMVRVPSSYGLSNTTEAACLSTAALPDCTTATLTTTATDKSSTYLWADATHPAYTFHTYLHSQAISRLENLPF